MITCPNCNHQNPDGALQCEACYTPLPALATCPNCQASVQADASFCGQCGYDLRTSSETSSEIPSEVSAEPNSTAGANSLDEPDAIGESFSEFIQSVDPSESGSFGGLEASGLETSGLEASVEEAETEPAAAAVAPSPLTLDPLSTPAATQIQTPGASLRHVQTQTSIAIPSQLSIVRIGKPNDHTPPDIDVSGFPESEIVSRVHANLLVEGNTYYLEDMGSSNGTYINGLPLPKGNRHRLNSGDRIAFGKGDKVSFIFETARY